MATTTIYNELIAVNAVSGTAIADNAVTSVHIAQNNVGTVQLALNSVTSVSIALNQVTGTQIANNAITSTQLADNAVTATKVPDGTQFTLGATTFSGNIIMGDDTSIGIADDAERIEFDGAGDISLLGANVGIGIDAPGSMLHLFDGGTDTNIRIQSAATADNTSSITFDSRLADNSNKQAFIKAYRGNLSITGDSGYGNLGIGVTAPTSIFDVRGSTDANIQSKLINTSQTTAGREAEFLFGKDNGANLSAVLKYYYHTTQASRRIDLFHYGTTNGLSILDDGKVGIGTTAPPHQKLTITGTSATADGSLANGILALTTGTGVIADTRLIFGIVDDDYAWIQPGDYGVDYRDLILNPNGGNTGIGTTSPSKQLTVSGPGGSGGPLVRLDQENGSGASGPSIDFGYSGQTWRIGANIHVNQDFTIQDTAGSTKVLRLDASGNMTLGHPYGINESAGASILKQTLHRDAGSLIELSADHAGSAEFIGGIDFSNDNNADAANNDADGKLVSFMRARTYTDDSNASDDSGSYIQFATKAHGDSIAERLKINHNGEIQIKGQRVTDASTQFAYKTAYYQWYHDDGGTHYIQVPLYSSYSSSNSGGWAEIDIAWLPDHAAGAHLHSYKVLWGSHHGRTLDLGVVSATATTTVGSYSAYHITSSSELLRHPTAGENNMTYLYIKLLGYHGVNKRRAITIRGVASADNDVASIGPIIDQGSTEPVANMISVNSAITATG